MEFMPEGAPLVVLSFLSTCFLLVVASVVVVHALVTGHYQRGKRVAGVMLAGAGFYFSILLAFSVTSHERVLAGGEAKYFCEIDCHLAYTIANVSAVKTLGTAPHEVTANGLYYVVTLNTWFDESTISSHRGNGPLSPNPRRITVLDEQERRFGPSAEGHGALDLGHRAGAPLTQSLRPGESYLTVLVFDLPSDVRNPRLLITDSDWVSHLLIGHENSFFHRKILFRLAPGGGDKLSLRM